MSVSNEKVEAILSLLEEKKFQEGYRFCGELIDSCEVAFAEALTVNTATDFIGSVIIFSQFSNAEKKPWKVIPQLERIRGALRFLEDYISDQSILASTFETVANLYAYSGFYPEAAMSYHKAAVLNTDENESKELFYRAFFYSIRSKGSVHKELIDGGNKKFSSKIISDLIRSAESDFAKELLFDEIERSDAFLSVRYDVEAAVEEALEKGIHSEISSYCLRYWKVKRSILKERYNISWKSPDLMNPQIRFC